MPLSIVSTASPALALIPHTYYSMRHLKLILHYILRHRLRTGLMGLGIAASQ